FVAQSHTPRTRCVRIVFGVAAASRNTRFQAARYGLTWVGLAPTDRGSFAWRLPSLDHLVGAQQERFGDVQPKSLGAGQIDDEIERGRLLDRQISGLCPAQNLVHVFGGAPESVREVRAIGYEASGFDALPKAVHRRQSCTQRESVDANSAGDYERAGYDIN